MEHENLLKACQRAAFVLAELPDQSRQILALRRMLVDAIIEVAPEYYGLPKTIQQLAKGK